MDEEGLPDEDVRSYTDPRAIDSGVIFLMTAWVNNHRCVNKKPVLLICVVVWIGLRLCTLCLVLCFEYASGA